MKHWNELSEEEKLKSNALIDAYIPSPRDTTLDDEEFYVLDSGNRCRRVYALETYCHQRCDTYGVFERGTMRKIDAGWNDDFMGFHRADLYDNKTDCKNRTHNIYENWEYLRTLQEERDI